MHENQACEGRSRLGLPLVAAVVLLAIAVAVWFVRFRSTPERTVHAIIAAFQADDDEAIDRWLTEASRGRSIDFALTVAKGARNATSPGFEVLEHTRSGDEAIVPVKIIVENGPITVSPTVNWVLLKEGWTWKLDVDRTKQRTLDDLIHLIGG